ncbi:MAG: mechanosensitive ion channel family protein [Methanomicrobiales archaeon]|nr:mechanosensitive ion channel family protein [Methanomicrobiales archaeon]
MILDTVIYRDVTLWNLVVVVIILGISSIVIQIINLNLKKALSDKIRKHELEVLLKVVRYTIIFLAVISVLPLLSIDLTGLLLAGGFAGLVIGFASQSVVSNLISGIFLVIERPIKIGDEIAIGEIEGYVEDIRFLSTVVRSYDGTYIRLPNEKVFTSVITNYVEDVARRILYPIGISYRDDVTRATGIIEGVLASNPYALKNPAPNIYVDSLGENSVNIVVRFWTPSTEYTGVKNELLWRMKEALDKAKIEFPFPQRVIWFKDEKSQESISPERAPNHEEESKSE